MKKMLKSALIIILAILMISPNTILAAESNSFENVQKETGNARTAGLIVLYGVSVSKKSAGVLKISGTLSCLHEVDKCGYRDLQIRRRPASSAVWEIYTDLGDLYIDFNEYPLTRTFNVPTGYYYRVDCEFYAKKNIFSTEKIQYTSSGVLI